MSYDISESIEGSDESAGEVFIFPSLLAGDSKVTVVGRMANDSNLTTFNLKYLIPGYWFALRRGFFAAPAKRLVLYIVTCGHL